MDWFVSIKKWEKTDCSKIIFFIYIIIVILNIIRIFCAAYVVFCLFLGGPIKGVCVEARTALNTSAIRCVWSLMSVFHPFDSITSVARLWWEGSRENKSGWTLQNLHCNIAGFQSRNRKRFPCYCRHFVSSYRNTGRSLGEYEMCYRDPQKSEHVFQGVSTALREHGKMFCTSLRK